MDERIRMLSAGIDEQAYLYNPYYEYAREGHFWIEWRFHVLLEVLHIFQLPGQQAWHGIDIGCGNGVVRRQLERATAWTVDGADLTLSALRLNQTLRGNTLLYNVFDCQRDLQERYDFVILFDVLEHIDAPAEFLRAVLFHLKPGGWIFLNVPALPGLFSQYDRAQGHRRRYTRRMMQTELDAQAVSLRDLRYWGGTLLPLAVLRKMFLSSHASSQEVFQKGFQMSSPSLNAWLLRAMRFEIALTQHPPLGTSLFASAVKNS